jgi:phospholipid-binding lipoprotein MlaA
MSRRLVPSSRLVAAAAVAAVAGCAAPPPPATFNDPDEARNREVHAFNAAVDRNVIRPVSGLFGEGRGPVSQGLGNVANNLGEPGRVVNGLLQGRPQHAVPNTLRFAINTTLGIGGLFDPATALGIEGRDTDFGETLHVWGAPEGAYVVVPFLGPSTDRDLLGTIVDAALDPLGRLLPEREARIATGVKISGRLADRSRFGGTVDSVLHESADSYAQTRLLYLQNRRFELGQTSGAAADEGFIDPYEDPYGQ